MRKFVALTLGMVLMALVVACSSAATSTPLPTEAPPPTEVPEVMAKDIVDVAIADGRFTTLVAALEAADLVDTLKGEGPFTVFAPTDEAFAKLPEGTVDGLLEDIPALTDVLLYHVVPGEVMAAEVVNLESADTALEQPLAISVDEEEVRVNDSLVIISDMEASNGVIHVIDSVLLPAADADMAKDIVDVAIADGRFTTLVAALEASDLVETLKGQGPFSVFAPTDEAFAKLPEGTVEGLLEDIPALTNVLLYHVVPGEVMAAEVVNLETADTALGEPIAIGVNDGEVRLNDSLVILTDMEASNGVIHVIDSVLLPPADADMAKDIVEIATADGRFTSLVAALEAADLVDTLKGEGPFTVFAPTDEAFAKLPEGTVDGLLEDIPALTDVLLYHVVPGEVMAAEVVNLETADTALEQPLAITVNEGEVRVNDSLVIVTDIEASNGVIHVIDSVLLPPSDEAMAQDIVDVAAADGRFTTLVAALEAAGLMDTLKGEGPFTVFAPTDGAFAKLPEGTVDGLLEDIPALTDVLLYHVVPGEVMAADVVNLETADTALEQPLAISVDEGEVRVNDSLVIVTDIEASNGVIHVIDSVLLPAS